MTAEPVRFAPSRVEGLDDVTEVVVSSTHLDLLRGGSWHRVALRDVARASHGGFRRLLHRLSPLRWPLRVGERDWFHPPTERFFRWYTSPPLTTYMPADEGKEPAASLFPRLRAVLSEGGFYTFDLG